MNLHCADSRQEATRCVNVGRNKTSNRKVREELPQRTQRNFPWRPSRVPRGYAQPRKTQLNIARNRRTAASAATYLWSSAYACA